MLSPYALQFMATGSKTGMYTDVGAGGVKQKSETGLHASGCTQAVTTTFVIRPP